MTALSPVQPDFRLADVDPDSPPGATGRKKAKRQADEAAEELADLQERLYADSRVDGERSDRVYNHVARAPAPQVRTGAFGDRFDPGKIDHRLVGSTG